MGSRSQESCINAAVAIDRDKNSQFAVKWAIENLNLCGFLTLIHVKTNQSPQEAVPKEGRAPTQDELKQFFLPYRGFCARKGVRVSEVILHDCEVAGALAEYVIDNSIATIVLGSSSRSALTRAFKSLDIQGNLIKSVPDFCSVYVVSKSKSQLVKAAKRSPNPNSTPRQYSNTGYVPESPLSEHLYNHSRSAASDISDGDGDGRGIFSGKSIDFNPTTARNSAHSRNYGNDEFGSREMMHFNSRINASSSPMHPSLARQSNNRNNSPKQSVFSGSSEYSHGTPRDRLSNSRNMFSGSPTNRTPGSKIPPSLSSLGSQNFHPQYQGSPQTSLSDSSDQSGLMSFLSPVTSFEVAARSNGSDDSKNSANSETTQELEDELKRLRQELKDTMEVYNSACKEAAAAKEKVNEIDQWKTDEENKPEDCMNSQDAALIMMEMEKAKCKAAIEAAQISQHIAELESQKRRHAEMKFLQESEEKRKAMDALARCDIRYRKYTIEEIEAATDHFDIKEKIGEGGYGPVYKAFLDHTPVAIKVLRPDISQGKIQFQREIEVLCRMRHPNMVLLLGACPEYGCLVYEYMENGSLEDQLYCRNGISPLSWRDRFRIASEIGTALLFLHQTKPEPLVHRDLKPANILIDKNFVSKIADVGLSRLVPSSVADSFTQYHMTAAAGTFCYIDPEYQQSGMLGTKSDIYSLGVVLLQILTGRPAMGLTYHVEEAIEQGTFAETLDPKITDWPVEEALSLAKLSLKCCELRKRDRPDLGKVILPELERLSNLGHKNEAKDSLSTDQDTSPLNQASQESMSISMGTSSSYSESKGENQS